MKIARLETIRVPEHPNSLWLLIHADDGRTGLGETYYLPGAVESVIHDFCAQYLLGQRVLDREKHWAAIFAHANFFGFAGAELRALSAIDIALWDLAGQVTGLPIHDLIGGRYRDTIPLYNTCVDTPAHADQRGFLERPGELARELLADGIGQMKVWPWDRFAPQRASGAGLGPAGNAAVGPPGHRITAAEVDEGLACVRGIRDAVGMQMKICIEGHSRWDLDSAIRIARAVEPFDVEWCEDLIQPNNVADLARLARETRAPQGVSERLITRHAFRPMLEAQAARVVLFDTVWTGGITEAIKIATLADAWGLPFAPHDCTGPVNVVASLHLCAALPNAMVMEIVRGFIRGWYRDVLDRPLPVRGGEAVLDFAPGLGFALSPTLLARGDLIRRVSG